MSLHSKVLPASCRRDGDRRQPSLRSFMYALFMTRRQIKRREGDAYVGYFDRYEPVTVVLALTFMLLCVADAYFTLLLIQRGAVELNPLLAWAVKQHVLLFFLVKYLISGLCVVVTVMHRRFRMFGIRGIHFLLAAIVAYIILIEYQLSMLLPFWLN